MEVSVRGHTRDCGWTWLAKADVSEARLPLAGKWQSENGVKIQRNKKGVTIRRSPIRLTLNGNYILEVELTKDDIRNMFVEAFADDPMGKALGSLAAASAARKTAAD